MNKVLLDQQGIPCNADGRRMLPLKDVSRRLGRERSWVTRMVQRGRIPALQIAGTWWVGTEVVDRYLQQTTTPAPMPVSIKPASTHTTMHAPETAQDWDTIPYFLWDSAMTWRAFWEALTGSDVQRRRWAYARLLEHGRWADIWKLVTLDDVARELPQLQFRTKHSWESLIASANAALSRILTNDG